MEDSGSAGARCPVRPSQRRRLSTGSFTFIQLRKRGIGTVASSPEKVTMRQPAVAQPVAAQPVVAAAAEEAVPADERPFSYDDAVALLKGSTGSFIAGYISLLVSIATLVVNLKQIDNDGSAAAAEEESLRGEYVACAAAFATGQVIPLVRAALLAMSAACTVL